MKNKKDFYLVALASLLITWIMLTIREAVSTSDNDQVRTAGKYYVNMYIKLDDGIYIHIQLYIHIQ